VARLKELLANTGDANDAPGDSHAADDTEDPARAPATPDESRLVQVTEQLADAGLQVRV
jgi:hypothetical protein